MSLKRLTRWWPAWLLGLTMVVAVVLWKNPAPQRGEDPAGAARQTASPRERERSRLHVSDRWQALVDDFVPREERLELAREIHAGLPPQDVDFLFASLRHKPLSGDEEKWWVVMNEIMENMRKFGVGTDRYSEVLGGLVADPSQPPVVRDYAIQHLAQWLSPAAQDLSPGEGDEAKRRQAISRIVLAIRDPSSLRTTIPGTGLMALVDISRRLDAAESGKIWNDLQPFLASVIGGSSEADTATRITAIQAVGIRRETAHLPEIRRLAENEAGDPSVRLSSIASLGFYGNAADREFLTSLSRSGTKYQYAAGAALKKMSQP